MYFIHPLQFNPSRELNHSITSNIPALDIKLIIEPDEDVVQLVEEDLQEEDDDEDDDEYDPNKDEEVEVSAIGIGRMQLNNTIAFPSRATTTPRPLARTLSHSRVPREKRSPFAMRMTRRTKAIRRWCNMTRTDLKFQASPNHRSNRFRRRWWPEGLGPRCP